MGFFFRKSLGFGPFRLNFTKSGVGVSAGIRGVRLSAGPRGTYINVGREGFYYRKKINVAQPQNSGHASKNFGSGTAYEPCEPVQQTETADVDTMVATSSDETIAEINSKLELYAYGNAPLVTVIAAVVVLAIVLILFSVLSRLWEVQANDSETFYALLIPAIALAVALPVVVFVGVPVIKRVRATDRLKRTTHLSYKLDRVARARYTALLKAFECLARSAGIWSQQTQEATHDWKRNAGANALITRRPIGVGALQMPGILVNVPVCGFDFGPMKLFFLPDQLFVLQGKRYGAVSYSAIQKSFSEVSFREDGPLPSDAEVVDYTWQFVNKNGGADRRFKYNRQIPVVRYAALDFACSDGLHIKLQVSNFQAALEFAESWDTAFRGTVGQKTSGHTQHRNQGTNQRYDQQHAADAARRQSEEDARRRVAEEARRKAEENGRRQAEQEERARTEQDASHTANNSDRMPKSSWDVLGIRPDASLNEITTAYRQKAKQYHPDRVEGLGSEFKQLADERTKEINAAYAELKSHFNQ